MGIISLYHPLGYAFQSSSTPAPGFANIDCPKGHGAKAHSIGERFAGEELRYRLGFWLFHNAAEGKITIQKADSEGRYVATLVARTQGVIGFLTANRRYTLISNLRVVDGGSRFQSESFEQRLTTRHRKRVRIHTFDREAGKIIVASKREDSDWTQEEIEIPANQACDDPIASFYNFRFGVYGNVERGKSFEVPTIPKKGRSNISIHIASEEKESDLRGREQDTSGKEFLANVTMDKEFTLSQAGKIEGWLSEELVPVCGRVRDVVLLGDVYGRLIERVINSDNASFANLNPHY